MNRFAVRRLGTESWFRIPGKQGVPGETCQEMGQGTFSALSRDKAAHHETISLQLTRNTVASEVPTFHVLSFEGFFGHMPRNASMSRRLHGQHSELAAFIWAIWGAVALAARKLALDFGICVRHPRRSSASIAVGP